MPLDTKQSTWHPFLIALGHNVLDDTIVWLAKYKTPVNVFNFLPLTILLDELIPNRKLGFLLK
tara:strand:+ start:209 stop:397 length:189 start_codon:yes stop_codon:yes gene_type:complete